jgi:hypothetical protein
MLEDSVSVSVAVPVPVPVPLRTVRERAVWASVRIAASTGEVELVELLQAARRVGARRHHPQGRML